MQRLTFFDAQQYQLSEHDVFQRSKALHTRWCGEVISCNNIAHVCSLHCLHGRTFHKPLIACTKWLLHRIIANRQIFFPFIDSFKQTKRCKELCCCQIWVIYLKLHQFTENASSQPNANLRQTFRHFFNSIQITPKDPHWYPQFRQ